jgi:hypothetical protein
MSNENENRPSIGRTVAWVCACSVIFGVLMGTRSQFEQAWVQMAVAGCAFAFLGLAIYKVQSYRQRRK